MDSLNNIDVKSPASKQTSIQMKMRFLALAHFQNGHSRTLIAKYLKVSRTSVNKWIQVFLEKGLDGLREKPRTGQPSFLSHQEKQQLAKYMLNLMVVGSQVMIFMTTSRRNLAKHTTQTTSIYCSKKWAFHG